MTRRILTAGAAAMAWAAGPEDGVRAVLRAQQDAWNRGDVRAFMQGYEKSERILFVGKALERGYDKVLARYLRAYPNRAAMGTLTFSDIEVTMLGADHASVLGRFHLARAKEGGGDARGIFTLVMQRSAGQWRIIVDHTS